MTDKGEKRKNDTVIDFGLGGMLKGIGNLTNLLSDMVETGERVVRRTGEFTVKGLGKAKGIYGLNVRMGLGGLPTVEDFGNIRATNEGTVISDEREPLVDVFDEGDEILVVAELPGVEQDDIRLEVSDDVLSLSTVGDGRFAKEILLPSAVEPGTMKTTCKNGVLEIRLAKAK